MARMLKNEQKFDSLKKRLSIPINSSYPVNRPPKSIGQRQFNTDSLQSNILNNDNPFYSINLIDDDLIPEELEYRRMTKEKFCNLCFCKGLEKNTLQCVQNQLNFIPILPIADRRKIKEIYFESQENLIELGEDQLKWYRNITKLTIINSGLSTFKDRPFRSNPHLKEIHLKSNQIKVLPRKVFDDIQYQELIINDNPLACNCSSKWIQLMINKQNFFEKFGPAARNLTCVGYSNKTKLLIDANITGCDLPVVNIDRQTIEVFEGGRFTLNCTAFGNPTPIISWNTTDLKSKYNITAMSTLSTLNGVNNLILSNSSNNNNLISNGIKNNTIIYPNNTINLLGKTTKPPKIFKTFKTIEVLYANGSDNGLFICYADNIVGKVSASVNVTILAPPKIELLYPDSKYEFCINFMITGNPIPSRTWYHTDKSGVTKKIYFNKIFTETFKDSESARNNFTIEGCLQISSNSHLRNGNYTLNAKNMLGEVNKTVHAIFINSDVPDYGGVTPLPPLKEEELKERSPISLKLLVYSCIGIFIFILSVAFVLYLGCIYYSKKRNYKNTEIFAHERTSLNLSRFVDNPNYQIDKNQQIINFNKIGIKHIDSKRIQLICELGEGLFGRVFLGLLDLDKEKIVSLNKLNDALVAVKVLKHRQEGLKNTIHDFEKEAELLTYFDHENIIKFHGISINKSPFMMIFEYMKFGDLNKFLRSYGSDSADKDDYLFLKNSTFAQINNSKNLNNNNINKIKETTNSIGASNHTYRLGEQNEQDDATEKDSLLTDNNHLKLPITKNRQMNDKELKNLIDENLIQEPKSLDINDLLSISIQVTNGIKYLKSQRLVHGDLAARNCLVTDGITVKIGDFGMSKDIYEKDYYTVSGKEAMPVRCMPPESIMYRKFTNESDVWSFGVLLYEVFTLGKTPFFELNNNEVINAVCNQYKILDQPKYCPNEIYKLMKSCWKYNPAERTSIECILDELENIKESLNERRNSIDYLVIKDDDSENDETIELTSLEIIKEENDMNIDNEEYESV